MGDELLKTIIWVGSSKKELLEFSEDVIDEVGYILYRVQKNKTHPHIKPLKGLSGVFEIVSNYQTDTYRTVYAIKLGNAVYVLHAFKKKSKTGIKTPKPTIDLIKELLKLAQEIAKKQD
ncbi:MAG: type II toxin-antitoxin system RelE/ParE family toxin [Xenococcus sp. (in: cyanobacteria)]